MKDGRPGSLLHAMKSRHSPTRRTLRKSQVGESLSLRCTGLNVFTTLSFVLPLQFLLQRNVEVKIEQHGGRNMVVVSSSIIKSFSPAGDSDTFPNRCGHSPQVARPFGNSSR